MVNQYINIILISFIAITPKQKSLEIPAIFVPYLLCAPKEIRTPVLALKGPRPSPLDDGGMLMLYGSDTGIISTNDFFAVIASGEFITCFH